MQKVHFIYYLHFLSKYSNKFTLLHVSFSSFFYLAYIFLINGQEKSFQYIFQIWVLQLVLPKQIIVNKEILNKIILFLFISRYWMYTVIRHQLKREAKIRTNEKIELGNVARISKEFRKGEPKSPQKDTVRIINLSIFFL